MIYTTRLIVVETLSGLPALPASVDHPLQQTGRTVLAVASLLVQNVHDGQTGVQADEVGQRQRTHGDVGAVLHDVVDVLAATDTSLEADDGLVDVGHEDAVGQETGRVGGDGGDLAHALHELKRGVNSLLGGLQAGDDLNALLDRDGVHEVRGDDARGGLEILGVRGGRRGDLGDGDGRGVGREDRVLGRDLGQLGEDARLQVGDLGNGLDHEVNGRQVVHLQGGGNAGADNIRCVAGETLLGDIFLQKFVCNMGDPCVNPAEIRTKCHTGWTTAYRQTSDPCRSILGRYPRE